MASLGSLSFLLETSSSSGCAILKRGKTQLKRNRIVVASYGRNHLGPSFPFKMRVGYDFGGEEGKKGKKGIWAAGKSGGIEGEEDGSEIEDIEKVLQKTIKQSKKVAERKKLVSSIKSNAVSTELVRASSDESDNSFSKLDKNSNSGELESKYSSGTDGFTNLTDIISVNPPASDSTEFFYKDKEFDNILPPKRSIAAALGLSGEASLLESAQSEIVSPSLSRLSEPYVAKKVNFDNLNKFDVEGASAEHDATHVDSAIAEHDATHVDSAIAEHDATPVESASAEHDATAEKGSDSSPLAGENVMNVILVAAECAPWSKSGGLGDVAGALPKALARRGHRVMVVTPRYGNYSEAKYLGVHKRYNVHGQDMEVSYYHAQIDGVDFVFMDGPDFRHRQNDMYGGKRVDILKRMILLCKAAVEVPWHVPCGGTCYGDGNLVFIANDWHTALIPVYLKAYYRDNGLMTYTRCVLVIHNISFQGRGPVDDFQYLDLPDHYLDLFKHYDPVGGEHMNIFLAGLKSADRFVTVSHGYAWELKTVEGGWGLHEIINHNHWKFQGIVNGIDANDWNPSCDVHLKSDGYTNYSLETLQTGKAQCKAALQRELGLPVRDDIPLIAFIGRLDYQKGVDIIAEAMPWIVGHDLQLVMLGTGRLDLEDMLRSFEDQHPNKVRGRVCFSVELAHRITAGADCILMPSRFEPCGLNQLYAMMYGTIPVVHAVGGLRDTVQEFDPSNHTGLGWTFKKAEVNGLIDALVKCFRTYWHHKSSWEGLQRRGMMQDLSWDNAATQYEKVLVAAKYHW